MTSLAIASRPGGCVDPADMSTQDMTPVSGIFPVDDTLRQLEIRIQAIQLWPYHAGPATRRSQCLDTAMTSMACCCPLHLSDPGKPSEPGTSLQVPPNRVGDTTRRLVAHRRRCWSRRCRDAAAPPAAPRCPRGRDRRTPTTGDGHSRA